MKATTTAGSRTVHLHAAEGDALPTALVTALKDVGVARGWLRGVGVVGDVVLRAIDAEGSFVERRIAGPAQLTALEGVVEDRGAPALSATIAVEGASGATTHVGTLTGARAFAFDAMVIELGDAAPAARAAVPPAAERKSSPTLDVEWGEAATPRERAKPVTPTFEAAPIPQRPKVTESEFVEQPTPEAGDMVEHFAFGTCEVVQSDGERIHLRLEKDQRIKEIALAMLKVVPLDLSSSPRIFKLERKL